MGYLRGQAGVRPISMFSIATSCTVAGIAVLDGVGNMAVYGTEYGEPDLGIKLTRVPDTTPPVATRASVSPASLPQSADSQFVGLTVDVSDPVAPVTEISETVSTPQARSQAVATAA
jgi:hypothetical protein